MNLSKRSPLLRNAWEKGFNDSVGKLEDDIQQQDLEGIEGGSTVLCGISAVTAVTTITCWVNDRATQIFGCGVILTTSAECSRTGNPC